MSQTSVDGLEPYDIPPLPGTMGLIPLESPKGMFKTGLTQGMKSLGSEEALCLLPSLVRAT